ncbi:MULTISPECIES: polysaccharide export protein [Pantoea]|jgi:polysaccharide export outer membrane protein|uniref:polysaccharide export protein n=1 Tax=Pantoea TaxID=53335 RepID=UPI000690B065|nr:MULTISPECIES: polysaccharide export protein [Pantoea]MDV3180054.1 polysaccharide export protein [Candidatus Phytoplasma australasiaticum]MCL9646622.1 polysaccharide biosynthesis/export family protein [Pantoea eucrina]MDJ0024574.1 polysaccharide export protein [Pantoea eucrina]NIE69295.1 polysaccharide export protein Wza [Pantoea sp. Acro-807]OIX97540.1 polysaccharide export protein Wza [Pantoea sp. Ae16]
MKSKLRLFRHSALSVALILCGCTVQPGQDLPLANKTLVNDNRERSDINALVRVTLLSPVMLQQLNEAGQQNRSKHIFRLPEDDYSYRIGVGDVLSITVWDHPEITSPAGQYRDSTETGSTVRPNGTLYFPYTGSIYVLNKTTEQVRTEITARLHHYIESPQVDVKIAAFRSRKAYVSGEVVRSGQQPITHIPLTVLDAINAAGGLTKEADWENVTLTHDAVQYPISLKLLLEKGDLTQNALLHHGDILYIPRNDSRKIFVMGETGAQKTLLMDRSGMTLTEAISSARGIDQTTADATGVFVIRQLKAPAEKRLADIYQINLKNAAAMALASDFKLQPYDIVYVTATPLTRWNRVVRQLIPTITAVNKLSTAVKKIP